jgi:hypothetical protein
MKVLHSSDATLGNDLHWWLNFVIIHTGYYFQQITVVRIYVLQPNQCLLHENC